MKLDLQLFGDKIRDLMTAIWPPHHLAQSGDIGDLPASQWCKGGRHPYLLLPALARRSAPH